MRALLLLIRLGALADAGRRRALEFWDMPACWANGR